MHREYLLDGRKALAVGIDELHRGGHQVKNVSTFAISSAYPLRTVIVYRDRLGMPIMTVSRQQLQVVRDLISERDEMIHTSDERLTVHRDRYIYQRAIFAHETCINCHSDLLPNKLAAVGIVVMHR